MSIQNNGKYSVDELVSYFKLNGTEHNLKMQKRFGINVSGSLGVSQQEIRKKAKKIKKSLDEKDRHVLALKLWRAGFMETRLLAGMIDVPILVTKRQMDKWVEDFDSWNICDTVCGDLFDKTPFVIEKIHKYIKSDKEFTKRAGFVLMACLSVHNKDISDKIFVQFLNLIKTNAQDQRNFVKKAVSWALRQIGKSRNIYLCQKALNVSIKLKKGKNKTERWVGSTSYNELKKMKSRF